MFVTATLWRADGDSDGRPRGGASEPEPQEPEDGQDPDASGLPEEDGYLGDLVIEGDNHQLGFAVGGKKPTSSSLRLAGGKVDIEGTFAKNDRLSLLVEVEIREVAFKDEVDSKTGQVVGCERKHRAHVTAVERAR